MTALVADVVRTAERRGVEASRTPECPLGEMTAGSSEPMKASPWGWGWAFPSVVRCVPSCAATEEDDDDEEEKRDAFIRSNKGRTQSASAVVGSGIATEAAPFSGAAPPSLSCPLVCRGETCPSDMDENDTKREERGTKNGNEPADRGEAGSVE